MKYDEKTGKKVPESRGDEIKLSFEALKKVAEDSGGTFDREVEIAWLLRDISQTNALLVDMMGLLLNNVLNVKEDKSQEEPTVQ